MDKPLPSPPRAPWSALLSLLTALLYDVSPIDFVPDLIPLLGWFDDGVVTVVFVFFAIASWRKWSKKRRTVALVK